MKKIDAKDVMRLLDKIEKFATQDPTARMPEDLEDHAQYAWKSGMQDCLLECIAGDVRMFRKIHGLTQETVDDFGEDERTLI